ncbi:MAG: NeuD/PglB/VioB family sugar acetyltransferase [Planctomycetota bacterium]
MSAMPYVILLGGGGHAAVVLDALRMMDVRCAGYVDDNADADDLDVPHLGTVESLHAHPEAALHAAVGASEHRQTWMNTFAGHVWIPVLHPFAAVASNVALGDGVFIGPLAVVNARAALGRGVIINSGAIVEHDNEIYEFAHIAPGAVLGGGVTVGEHALVGLGSRVLPNVRIGSTAVIGAGAVVTEDVEPGTTVAGVPARPR